MSIQDVENEILRPMQSIYLPPRQYDEPMIKASLLEYAKALEGFPVDDLRYAWARARDTHSGRAWPVPGVFVSFAAKNKNDRMSVAGTTKTGSEAKKQNDAWKNWERVRNTDQARDAAQKGVSWALKCEILGGTNPGQTGLIERLVRGRASAERTAARIRGGLELYGRDGRNLGVMRQDNADIALALYAGILRHEAETAREIGFSGQVNAVAPDLDYAALVP